MRDAATTLPPAFSLLQSEFNAFLFAPIGEESNDTLLTVLSALARLGLDPWQESARLARLSREKAIQSLASLIAALPNGRWAPSESSAIAARLVALLPAKGAASPPPPRAASSGHHGKFRTPTRIETLVIAVLLGGMIFLTVTNLMRPTTPSAPDKAPATSESSPAG